MIRRDLHLHTVFSDGANTPEETVVAAIEKGMTCIGFSDHSYTSFDPSYCMRAEDYPRYREEIARLQEVYGSRIRILCGIEQDFYSDLPAEGFDYVIGAVHYLRAGGRFVPVDESPEILLTAAGRFFDGDIYALAAAYYDTVAAVWEKTRCNIVAHFDLIAKFNEGGVLFNEEDPRYRKAWRRAADALKGRTFEINTGAVARGWRTVPYPAAEIYRYLKAGGASFLLSGDSHRAEDLCFDFDKYEHLV